MGPSPWDALLFDFDGVLADTEKAHHASWNKTLEPFGIQFSWEDYLTQCVGIADRMLVERLKLPNPAAAVANKQKELRANLLLNPPFFSQTLDLVRELAQEHRLAVVSSSARPEIEPLLEVAGIRSYFEIMVTSEDVSRLKPAPDPYLLAAEKLGVRKPLVIEDSDAGVASGKAAGFDVLRVSRVDLMPQELRAMLANSQ
ncbi:MAG: HAD family phosphatase [Acidobacteriota bacterium]